MSGAATTHARLRILSNVNPAVGDTSDGDFAISLREGNAGAPLASTLGEAYPNPFNPTTSLTYQLAEAAHVRLEVFDLAGRRVAELVNTEQAAGEHRVRFDGAPLAAGNYFVRMQAGNFRAVRKVLLLK